MNTAVIISDRTACWDNSMCSSNDKIKKSIGFLSGNLNDGSPWGPGSSYRTGRVTHHTLCREIAFPRTAFAPSAML